jgi:hypothetical protein
MPITTTVCPGRTSARRKAFIAHASGSPGNGCSARTGGITTAEAAAATSYSAKAWVESVATRSPTTIPSTPSPTESTSPQPSWPGAPGSPG